MLNSSYSKERCCGGVLDAKIVAFLVLLKKVSFLCAFLCVAHV